MTKMKHFAASFIIFGMVVSLFAGVYSHFVNGYDIVETNNKDGINIMESLSNSNFISGINSIMSGVYGILAPSNIFDILGSLASIGTGLFQAIGGIIEFPKIIFDIVGGYYPTAIPEQISVGIGALVVCYVAFSMLSAYLRGDF